MFSRLPNAAYQAGRAVFGLRLAAGVAYDAAP